MDIDNNVTMRESLRVEKAGDLPNAYRLREDFTAEFRQAQGKGQNVCSCTVDCIYHGRCAECIAIHRGHRQELPNCLEGI